MRFFDVNCFLGPFTDGSGSGFETADALMREMDDVGIERAMVAHRLAQTYPLRGNRILIQALEGHDRLWPVAIIQPGLIGTFPEARDFLAQLDEGGVRMVRLYLAQWAIQPWMIEELLAGLAARRILLHVDLSATRQLSHEPVPAFAWSALRDLARAQPGLKIVLFAQKLGAHDLQVRSLLRTCPNVVLDMSAFQLWRATEQITETFGPDRLLFGSYAPAFQAAQFVIQVRYAQVPATVKARIAAGNLETLLGCPAACADAP